ncbi:DUF6192 family protein [Streptomyces sp. NRRL F-525]|uniref:DUF6192 family protein n=1 Tax=Streptomyces sp. NRRL F-525 TaxID=1463861 RepID=UPI0006910058|nr:DUF6192 family protein [Streptomyces sp. NRRL F-525]
MLATISASSCVRKRASKLRGHEFTDTQTKVLENHLEKIRATADWIATAAATGQVDLDEQLAQLLRGQ